MRVSILFFVPKHGDTLIAVAKALKAAHCLNWDAL
jgi:hypothetical protein